MSAWITGVVAEIDLTNSGFVLTTPQGMVTISLPPKLHSNLQTLWKGATVSCHLVGTDVLAVVLEPEQILDVTEVAECITPAGDFPSLAILRSLQPRTQSVAALRGSLINAAFDLLVQDDRLTDADILLHVANRRGLSLASIGNYDSIIHEVSGALPRLRTMLQQFDGASISVEPHVISSVVGLQGRFDIKVDWHATGTTDIIELKTGSAPIRSRDSHLAQLSAYSLLHELYTGTPPSSCKLWYLSDNKHQLRTLHQETVHAFQQRLLSARNHIVAAHRQFRQRDFSVLRGFSGNSLRGAGVVADFEDRFALAYSHADTISRTAAQVWLNFLAREQYEAMLGLAQTRTTADLWRLSPVEKSESLSVLLNLTVAKEHSDFSTMHIRFNSANSVENTALRRGDLVYFHKQHPDVEHSISSTHLLVKGTLQHIDEKGVTVSIRNKQTTVDELLSTRWIMEQDINTSGLRQFSSGIIRFLQAADDRRQAILGTYQPRFSLLEYQPSQHLTPKQSEVVSKALTALDWFLIQGPPGTGKTSILLREIVAQLVGGTNAPHASPPTACMHSANPHERVLVLAYTNRAVNEICRVLADVLPQGSFYRHGTTMGVEADMHDVSIAHLASISNPTDLAEKLRSARCIVSTIHAMHSQPEIFSFGSFTTAVIDEASQVLDVQVVGILTQVKRHILIGDHKQLPPVVMQSEDSLGVHSPLLAGIGLTSQGISIFQRLASICEEHGWNGALAMLESQGRMHADVMQFPSLAFYGNQLRTAAEWQQDPSPLPWSDILPHRTMFIHEASVSEEAIIAARLAEYIANAAQQHSTDFSIGIITPFRVQNNRVLALLPEHLRTSIMVDTVERFQGSQRDVIIYATSVANLQEFDSIRSDLHGVDRKLNVAATRARHQFVMIGNKTVLQASASYAAAIAMMTE